MADIAGEADIKGINIDKLAKGFADLEPNKIKSFVGNSVTPAREIRWYQKTSGFIDTQTTDDTAGSLIGNTSMGRPFVAEQSWTRNTSYVKTFFVESPMLAYADLKDNDVDLLSTTVRDLVRSVQRKVGLRMFEILTNALAATPTQPLTGDVTVQTTASTDGWNNVATANPILDILNGQMKIRQQGYDAGEAIIAMNSIEHKYLISYLINVKGSSIPSFSSEKLKTGVVMEILGNNVIVDEIFTSDWVYQWVPTRVATWRSFTPISSAKIEEPLIGVKIRVKEEGELILHDPNAMHIISDTIS